MAAQQLSIQCHGNEVFVSFHLLMTCSVFVWVLGTNCTDFSGSVLPTFGWRPLIRHADVAVVLTDILFSSG